MAKKKELGKGIRALLSNIESKTTKSNPESVGNIPKGSDANGVLMMSLSNIEANTNQPRKSFNQDGIDELAQSIKQHGIIQPITVRKIGGKKYQVISGERRFRASKLAGLKKVPVFVREANDQELLEMALVENIQREDLNAMEIAIGYSRLIEECGLSHEGLSERVAKKRSTISNYLRLLKLPPEIQKSVMSNEISMGHARALAGIDEVSLQLDAYKTLIQRNLSVRDLEKFIKNIKKPSNGNVKSPSNIPTELVEILRELKGKFGTNISVQRNNKGQGKFNIPFKNDEELNYILDVLSE